MFFCFNSLCFFQEEEVARTKLDVGRTGRELEEAKKKIVVVEREKEELQEDRGIHKAEASELKRQIGYWDKNIIIMMM